MDTIFVMKQIVGKRYRDGFCGYKQGLGQGSERKYMDEEEFEKCKNCVSIEEKYSYHFQTERGARQRNVLPPFSFNIIHHLKIP